MYAADYGKTIAAVFSVPIGFFCQSISFCAGLEDVHPSERRKGEYSIFNNLYMLLYNVIVNGKFMIYL